MVITIYTSGHVGLIIGQRAHKEVWPKVANWLREHSYAFLKEARIRCVL